MKKLRILLTLSCFEGHDLGLRIIARKCAEAGMEVIYTRFYNVDEIITAARDEDVDVIGISSYTGTHLYITSELLGKLKQQSMDIPVMVGGVIPKKDTPKLLHLGVKKVITTRTPASDSVKAILEVAGSR